MTCTGAERRTYPFVMPAGIVFYDAVKAFHIMAVVLAYGLPAAYPVFIPYVRRRHPEAMVGVHDVQHRLNQWLTGPGTALILLFGIYMASKHHVWGEVWVIVPLVIIAVIGAVGGGVIVPATAQLSELAGVDLNGTEYARVYRRYMAAEVLL